MKKLVFALVLSAPMVLVGERAGSPQGSEPATAIVGATIIDGNGGDPISDGTVVVVGERISAVGPRASVRIPQGAKIIDGAGKYITPGFIDTNVHVSLFSRREQQLARFQHRVLDITIEAAQMHLKYGITTIRDSYGQLIVLKKVRDAIERGEVVGPRLQVAGNIVGWGGPFSVSFSLVRDQSLTLFQEQMNDLITQGSGEELMDMTLEELRVAINKYLDKGPDFIKYGGTSHWGNPTFIGFSGDAQKVIVKETHKRGLVAETHSTNPEGLRISVLAGIDLIQHPEYLIPREMPDDLARLISDRKVICAMSVNNAYHGEAWKKHLKDKAEAEKRLKEAEAQAQSRRPKTLAERRKERRELGLDIETWRQNAQKLIRVGAVVSIASDNTLSGLPDGRPPKPDYRLPGTATLIAIEGMVEIGMTPSQAIVAATKNGALACGRLKDFGTLEPGKLADLLLLEGDPLSDIHNIWRQSVVMLEGRIIDTSKLPEKPVFFKAAGGEETFPGDESR